MEAENEQYKLVLWQWWGRKRMLSSFFTVIFQFTHKNEVLRSAVYSASSKNIHQQEMVGHIFNSTSKIKNKSKKVDDC